MQAFAAFRAYRDYGPRRSLPKAARAHYGTDTVGGGKVGQFEKWSSRWSWVARATAWDDLQDAEARHAELEAVKAMRARHAQLGQTMAHRVLLRLVGGEATIAGERKVVEPLDPTRLGPAALARLAEAAVKIERLSRGEPDQVVGQGEASGAGSVGDEQDLARRILDNPHLTELAGRLASALSEEPVSEVPAGV